MNSCALLARSRCVLVASVIGVSGILSSASVRAQSSNVAITTPSHGTFTSQNSITVEGTADGVQAIEVNGVEVTVDGDSTWSTVVNLDPARIFNPIVAQALDGSVDSADRIIVVAGDSLQDGQLSTNALGAQVDKAELRKFLEPLLIQQLQGQKFKTEEKGPLGVTVKIDGTVNKVEWKGDFVFAVDKSEGLEISVGATDVRADMDDFYASYLRTCAAFVELDFYVHLRLDQVQIDDDGQLLFADALRFEGRNADFRFKNFYACHNRLTLPNGMPDNTGRTIATFIRDEFHKSAGPMIAETVPDLVGDALAPHLAPIDLSSVFELLGTEVDFAFSDATANSTTMTISADVGAVSMCEPPDGSPVLGASYDPANGAQFPSSSVPSPWMLGASASTSMMNQLLKTQIECGLLQTDVEELDVFNNGTLLPTTLGFLTIVVPALSKLTANGMNPLTVVRIELRPSLAPIALNGGPNDEFLGLKVGQLMLNLIDTGTISNFPNEGAEPVGPEQLILSTAIDADLGVDPGVSSFGIGFDIGVPPTENIVAVVTENPMNLDAPTVEGVLPGLFPLFLPALASVLQAIPMPKIDGFQPYLGGAKMHGENLCVYGAINLSPSTLTVTTSNNVTVTIEHAEGTIEDCGLGCELPVYPGYTVRLWAEPDSISVFEEWQGPCAAEGSEDGRAYCDIAIGESPVVVHAEADTPMFRVDLAVTGSGVGSIRHQGNVICGWPQNRNQTRYFPILAGPVTLTAVEIPPSIFTGWSGACSGKGSCTLDPANGDQSLNANFWEDPISGGGCGFAGCD